MMRRPPRATRTGTLCPYRTLCRSATRGGTVAGVGSRVTCCLCLAVLVRAGVRQTRRTFVVKSLGAQRRRGSRSRSEEHTSELQSLICTAYAVFCLKKKTTEYTGNFGQVWNECAAGTTASEEQ